MNSTLAISTHHHRYSTVTLDMGFTLVDLRSNYDRELIAVAARAGYEITLDDVRRAMTDVWEEQLRRESVTIWEPSQAADDALSLDIDRRVCLHLGIPDPQMHQIVHAMARQIFHDPLTYHIFPDVFPTLEALRSLGLRLGIVSNWDWCLPDLCQILGLSPYFDFIVASARVGAAKPHPAIFQAALQQAGSDSGRTLHVGDNLAADVRGAQAVGITAVWLDRACTNPATDNYPVVCRLDEILALLA